MRPGSVIGQAYDYALPESFIAQRPVSPRDNSKLLVVDQHARTPQFGRVKQLLQFLPPRSVLVFNETKVIPARIDAKKDTGGKVEILILRFVGHHVVVLADRKLVLGQTIFISQRRLTVSRQQGAEFTLRLHFHPRELKSVLNRRGRMPIPPYIKHTPMTSSELRQRYQSVFARQAGSAAAPTASLHFTKHLLKQLSQAGVAVEFITLHVGLGTFAPLRSEQIRTNRLHAEDYEISRAAAVRLNRWKAEGRPIIAVGTTVARALESATRRGRLTSGQRSTDIFIRPGYRWKFVDGLITNFHVPRSSLMMLVASLIGRARLLRLYETAKQRRFRFFSFGDAMFIRP